LLRKMARRLTISSATVIAAVAATLALAAGTAGAASAGTQSHASVIKSQTPHIIGTKVFEGKSYPEIYVPGAVKAKRSAVPESAGPSEFVNFHSDKVAEVYNWGTANGDNVDQWTYDGGSNQKWVFNVAYTDQAGNPVGNIVNVHSGKCFEVYNWAAGDGSNVDQWNCAPLSQEHSNQLWDLDSPLLVAVGASVERNLTVVAEVHAWGTANGDNVDIWHFTAGANQEWDYGF
jgi:hypothetical protein